MEERVPLSKSESIFLQPDFPGVEQLDIFAGLILLKYLHGFKKYGGSQVWFGGVGSCLVLGLGSFLVWGAGFRLGLLVAHIWVGRGWVLGLGAMVFVLLCKGGLRFGLGGGLPFCFVWFSNLVFWGSWLFRQGAQVWGGGERRLRFGMAVGSYFF